MSERNYNSTCTWLIFDVTGATLLAEPHVPLGFPFNATTCCYSIQCMSSVYTVIDKVLLNRITE